MSVSEQKTTKKQLKKSTDLFSENEFQRELKKHEPL